jgi:hypothetical protein
LKLTNKFHLPDAIIRGVRKINEQYDNGGADISATQLITSPRINALRKRHFSDMEKDVSEEWYAAFGSALHYILSLGAANGQIAEERLHGWVNGFHISGAIDLQTPKPDSTWKLSDYKVCPVYAVQKSEDGGKEEWEEQLNVLAYLAETSKGVTVSEVEIVAVIRDWSRTQAQSDPYYPVAPIVPSPIRLWSPEERETYVRRKVFEHQQALMDVELGEPLPPCNSAERWSKPDKWAVYKNSNKRASKVFDNEEEAESFIAANETAKDKYRIEHRPGQSTRCVGDYCGVSRWCEQWAEIKADMKKEEDEDV